MSDMVDTMFFLVNYNRSTGNIEKLVPFESSRRKEAEEERLSMELELGKNAVDREVVLLEAENEEALRTTHKRYFVKPLELANSISKAV